MTAFATLLLIGALIAGVALFGLTMSVVYYLGVGLVLGALARLVLPGKEEIGLVGTALVGLAGGAVGGTVGHALGVGQIFELGLSVAAAVVLLIVFGFRAKDRRR
jgi:uncharacterized membrane protein YeaQ/YmgE (transglycosylase-associated protein family)